MPLENEISEKLDMLRRLYPWYKEEIYRRRHQMIWLTAFTSGVLVLLLFLVPVLPEVHGENWRILASIGVVLFSGISCYVILQQRARHRLAKQLLITIEQALGLYEEGR